MNPENIKLTIFTALLPYVGDGIGAMEQTELVYRQLFLEGLKPLDEVPF